MWIFTPEGFYSVVMRRGMRAKVGRTHQVRARVREDLEYFIDFMDADPKRYPIIETPTADYRYRIMVSRRDLNKWWNHNMDELNYSNFKSEAAKVLDHDRTDDLHDVWQIMADRQPGGAYGWKDRKKVEVHHAPAKGYTSYKPRTLLDDLDDHDKWQRNNNKWGTEAELAEANERAYDDWEARNQAYNDSFSHAYAVEADGAKRIHEMNDKEWMEYQEEMGLI